MTDPATLEFPGLTSRHRRAAWPHTSAQHSDGDGLTASVQVWCDQVTLYAQLGSPSGFSTEGQW